MVGLLYCTRALSSLLNLTAAVRPAPSIVTFTAHKFPLISHILYKSLTQDLGIHRGIQLKSAPSVWIAEFLTAGLRNWGEIFHQRTQEIINVGLYFQAVGFCFLGEVIPPDDNTSSSLFCWLSYCRHDISLCTQKKTTPNKQTNRRTKTSIRNY